MENKLKLGDFFVPKNDKVTFSFYSTYNTSNQYEGRYQYIKRYKPVNVQLATTRLDVIPKCKFKHTMWKMRCINPIILSNADNEMLTFYNLQDLNKVLERFPTKGTRVRLKNDFVHLNTVNTSLVNVWCYIKNKNPQNAKRTLEIGDGYCLSYDIQDPTITDCIWTVEKAYWNGNNANNPPSLIILSNFQNEMVATYPEFINYID